MIYNIHENITQFWLAEKGVQFFCNTSKKLVIRVQIANMVSDWLKTQKKPPRTNQIRAVFTTNKLLITDYAKVKKIKNNGCNNTQTSYFQQFEWTRIQVSMIYNRDFKSRTLFVGGERCPVALFESFVERRPLLKHPCDGLFFSTSVANETKNLTSGPN